MAEGARCIACGARLGRRGERLYDTPKGPAYLCGRKACEKRYNGQPTPPATRRRR